MKSLWRSSFLTLFLVAVDALALAQAWMGAYAVRRALNETRWFPKLINPEEDYSHALALLLPAWLFVLAWHGFYRHHDRIASLNRLWPVVRSVFWMVILATVYNWTHRSADPQVSHLLGRSVVGGFAVAAALWLLLSRTAFRVLKRRAIQKGHGRVRALVVGAGEVGRETMARVHEHPDIGFHIVGFIAADRETAPRETEIEGCPVLGGMDELLPAVQRCRVEEVFLAAPSMEEDEIFHLVEEIQAREKVCCKVVANMLYVIANRAKVDEIIGLPVIAFRGGEPPPAARLVRRAVDLAAGGVMALALAPFSLLFALLIRIDSPGPVLFAHDRVGTDGKLFRMYKFRTMRAESDAYAEAPLDQKDPRVTRFGRFLRKTSLDEIPQVWNILRGDMGLIGPRPEMPFIVDTYKAWQAVRLKVKPGITGLWQVAGRKNLPLHFNLEYDFYYVKNQSLALDAEILLRTIPAVVVGRGAY